MKVFSSKYLIPLVMLIVFAYSVGLKYRLRENPHTNIGVKVGDQAPRFAAKVLSGETVSLEKVLKKSKSF